MGLPEQAHVKEPPVAVAGVRVTVTAAPTLLEADPDVPVTVTTPAVDTVAPETRPTALIEQSAPTVVGIVPLADCVASVMQVRAPLAANISSETLARTV